MPRCIYQIEYVFIAVICFVYGSYRLTFYGNASLTLQVHIVKHLCLHLSAGQQSGLFYNPVCKCRLTMVYMCNNTKISNLTLVNSHLFFLSLKVDNNAYNTIFLRFLQSGHYIHIQLTGLKQLLQLYIFILPMYHRQVSRSYYYRDESVFYKFTCICRT